MGLEYIYGAVWWILQGRQEKAQEKGSREKGRAPARWSLVATSQGCDHQEGKKRVVRPLFGLLLLLFLVVSGFVVWHFYKNSLTSLGQLTVVIDGDPVIVASWQRDAGRLVLITIPANLYIDVVHGLGTYPIRSLWQLGVIEGADGLILSQSLEELLAIPTKWYIGQISGIRETNATSTLRQVLAPTSVLGLLSGRVKTNLPLTTFLWLVWQHVLGDRGRVVSVAIAESVATRQQQPDGTTLLTLRPEAVDAFLGDEFEDRQVREENLTIAVYNTTSIPGLAERVARRLGRIGGNVVSIGNQEGQVERCQVRGQPETLVSTTAEVIRQLFNCNNVAASGGEHTDLSVFIGREFAARFLPLRNPLQ